MPPAFSMALLSTGGNSTAHLWHLSIGALLDNRTIQVPGAGGERHKLCVTCLLARPYLAALLCVPSTFRWVRSFLVTLELSKAGFRFLVFSGRENSLPSLDLECWDAFAPGRTSRSTSEPCRFVFKVKSQSLRLCVESSVEW